MIDLFLYNWQIRDEWFQWCETIPQEELMKKRAGGIGSILHNLYHVIDCEQIWINHLKGTPEVTKDMNSITTLHEVREFSELTRATTRSFLESLNPESENEILNITTKKGDTYTFTYGKVLRHIITHEIHHIGQLSVWSREIGLKPISSDLIVRDYC